MNNKQTPIIDSVVNFFKEILVFLPLCVLIFAFLAAPLIGYAVRGNMMAQYNIIDENNPIIIRKMRYVWIFLWFVAIISWLVVISFDMPKNGGCMP